MAVVFSDIVQSTALRNRMGEVDFTILREAHDAVAADLVEACGGKVVRWQGDGLVVAFSSAGHALEYASMLQPSVDRLGDGDAHFDLRIGIGLGDVLNETTGDYDGPAFVDAARLCDAAEPRQVLCTDLVTRVSRAYSADDFGPPVEMTLKGLGAVEVREFLRRASPTVASGLTVSVLGSLRAERAGRELEIGGPKERRVLAVLAAAPGSAVGVDELIEALWSDDPPRTAERSVHAYVARLRKTLEPSRDRGAPPRVIVTEGRGYRLVVGRDALDSTRFEQLTSTARADLGAGHALRARRAIDEALTLWRGAPFTEHFDAERCAQEAHRLEELRQLALEDLTTARLALGEAAELVPELEALVKRHPLQERLWANLMVALYRAGRQADALRSFQRARAALVDELGVEPGPELRHLEAAILEHDPSLLTSSPGAGSPSRRLPAALDPGGAALVGRDDELALLRAAWERAFAGRGEFVAVVGPDGVGKTRLVAELAIEANDSGAVILHARCDAGDRGPEALFDRALGGSGGSGAQFAEVPTGDEGTVGASLARFLASWSGGRPVLLSLDDVHLADTSTLEALADLAEWSEHAPLLVVATFRPDEADELESGPGRIVLRALSRDAVHAIAKVYRDNWSDAQIDELAAVTQGTPRAVHRVASAWAKEAARQQVHAATERATEARVRLVATRGDLADGIEGLQRLIEQRQVQLAPLATADGTPRVPYRGLAAFELEDADLYFGREQLLVELVTRVATAPIVVVVGASGSGKSSLVRAGLLAALEAEVVWDAGAWSSTIVTPGRDPIDALAAIPARVSTHHVVVVDPLEELWTACDDVDLRQAFCDALVEMSDDERFAVVVCVRADFVDRVAAHPTLAALVSANTLLVPPMTSEEFRRVVEGPARRTGLSFEPQLVEAVVGDVEGRPGALPLLSTALLATWERREGRTLTLKGYRAAGGVPSAIASMADSCYDALSPASQRAARRILLQLSGEENGVDVRRRVPLSTLGLDDDPDVRAALDALVARRLVIIDHTVVEVAHEALLRDWPRLASWLDEDRSGRRVHQRLVGAAAVWRDSARDASQLYRGTQLESALEWAHDHNGDLTPVAREFLVASRAQQESELHETRRRARRFRRLTVALAALLVVAVVTGAVSFVERSRADQSASRAAAQALAADAAALATQARAAIGEQGELGLLLAVEARRLHPSVDTDGTLKDALLSTLQGVDSAFTLQPRSSPYPNLSPDGTLVAVPGGDGFVRLYDAATGRVVRRLDGPPARPDGAPDALLGALFNRDGSLLSVGGGGTVRVWDVASGRRVGRPLDTGAPGPAYGTFDPIDNRVLFTVSNHGQVRRWDLHSPNPHPEDLFTVPAATGTLLFFLSPDGRFLLVGDQGEGPTSLWDLDTRTRLTVVDGVPSAFGPDGTTFVTTTRDGRVEVRDTDTLTLVASPVSFNGAGNLVASSADGKLLAVKDFGTHAIRVVDVATGTDVVSPITLHTSDPLVRFLPDGRLFTASAEKVVIVRVDTPVPPIATVLPGTRAPGVRANFTRNGSVVTFNPIDGERLWNPLSGAPLQDRAASDSAATDVVSSPDRRKAVLSDGDDALRIVDTRRNTAGTRLPIPDDHLFAVRWSPDSSTLALVFAESTTLWRVGDGARPHRIARLHPDGDTADEPPWHTSVSFSPDSRRVVVIREHDGVATMFDATTGRRLRAFALDRGDTMSGGTFSPDTHTFAVAVANTAGINGASGVQIGSVVFFNVKTGAVRQTLTLPSYPRGVAYTNGGRRVVTLHADGTGVGSLQIWDRASQQPVGEPLSFPAGATSLEASTDGRLVVHETDAGFALVWDLDPADWSELACGIAGRALTRTEWDRYLPGHAYSPECNR